MIERHHFRQLIRNAFKTHPIVAILGPRQCGKTTMAKAFVADVNRNRQVYYFDLEDPSDLASLDQPKFTLASLSGCIVIDEVQRKPNLFNILRVLVDRPDNQQRYLILGSASRELLQQTSESLAGRIAYLELTPFTYTETKNTNQLLLRGGFPKSYLAESEADSVIWRKNYVRTFLEQDIPSLGINIAPPNLRKFWMMLTHYHANTFNGSELARALGVTQRTIRNYLDVLSSTLMIRQLQPWFENISKRQVKSPKIYFRDSGIFHVLANVETKEQLMRFPKIGASWEGFALEEIIRLHNKEAGECFFWATHAHAELDLMIMDQGKRLGFEFKYADAPRLTKSMHIAMHDLKLDKLIVINPEGRQYQPAENIEVISLENYLESNAKDQ